MVAHEPPYPIYDQELIDHYSATGSIGAAAANNFKQEYIFVQNV